MIAETRSYIFRCRSRFRRRRVCLSSLIADCKRFHTFSLARSQHSVGTFLRLAPSLIYNVEIDDYIL